MSHNKSRPTQLLHDVIMNAFLSHLSQRKPVVFGGLVAIVALIGWWRYSTYFPNTDNAYVGANVSNIAPQVTGPVINVAVQNHQVVKAGQLLFEIDPKPFQVALDSAQAAYDLAKQQADADAAAVDNAKAIVKQRFEDAQNAKESGVRSLTLAAKGVLSKQAADDAKAHMHSAYAAWQGSQAQLKQAQAILGQAGLTNAKVAQAKAALDQAALSLQYTKVYAPTDGVVENLSLHIGDVVTTATVVFSVIDNSRWWVDANFKETQLERLRLGQSVKVELDMYDHHVFHGVVESISAGSGSTFSLLPPENATGNWVKVTQRFPVRVRIADDAPHYPLRVGASATVTVNTWSRS